MWIIDPFAVNIEDRYFCMNEKESLINLSSDDSLKAKFQTFLSRTNFFSALNVNIHNCVKKQ